MFGSALGQSQPSGGGLFGSLNTNTPSQQNGSSIFSNLGQNKPQQQQQSSSGLFGSVGQTSQNQQQGGGGLFTGLGQSAQQNQQPQQQGGGMFSGLGQSAQQSQQSQQQGGGLFSGLGQSAQQSQQPQQGGGLFGSLGQSTQQNQQPQSNSMFGGLGQSNQQQSNHLGGSMQRPNSIFGGSQQAQPMAQSQQAQLGGSLWQPGTGPSPREKSIPDQIATVVRKWDIGNPDCSFKYYFYNKVEESLAPYYGPAPAEDPKAWEEALSKKPGPGYVPVLCSGFAQLGERISTQQRQLAMCNGRLHEINDCLSMLLRNHDTKTSVRIMEAKRRHLVLRQRVIAIAGRTQVLKNRGYALGADEEDLKVKLQKLEKAVFDPGLTSRAEEIWAKMTSVQERVGFLRAELEKTGAGSVDSIDEETSRKAKKLLEDYQTQITHLKKEVEAIQKDYKEWEMDHGPATKMQKVEGR